MPRTLAGSLLVLLFTTPLPGAGEHSRVDYNRDIRPILSANCFSCHGQDEEHRQAHLRLDQRMEAVSTRDAGAAIVPGSSADSEVLRRIIHGNPEERMPPITSGRSLSAEEIERIRRWIDEGAEYREHWSFLPPIRRPLPEDQQKSGAKSPIDVWVLHRLEEERRIDARLLALEVSPEADRATLARRVTLDLTGLPPTLEEMNAFLSDSAEKAYERLADRLLESPAYGERWARMWLDLARFADSAGHGSDPLRPMWRYRDWVIDAFNKNLPFDQFTIEQLAGDLLPAPTVDQLLATAFHRNTMTQTEGGTDDEEFRVLAVKDRATTTMQVWMGLTLGCAECHDHKFDPISQREFYQVFAFFNQTEDTDQPDDRPRIETPTQEQEERRNTLRNRVEELERILNQPDESLDRAQRAWERAVLSSESTFETLRATEIRSKEGTILKRSADEVIVAEGSSPATDAYEIIGSFNQREVTALRLEALADAVLPGNGPGRSPGNGNFVLNDVRVRVRPKTAKPHRGRFVRVSLEGPSRILSLAEVGVFGGGEDNVALGGRASQSSVDFEGSPERAIDGNTDGDYFKHSVTHNRQESEPWWEVDLQDTRTVERIVVWNRTDGELESRLQGAIVEILDAKRERVWFSTLSQAPTPSRDLDVTSGFRDLPLSRVNADFEQQEWPVAKAIDADSSAASGWAIAPEVGRDHRAIFALKYPVPAAQGLVWSITMVQSFGGQHTLGRFRWSASGQPGSVLLVPDDLRSILARKDSARAPLDEEKLRAFHRSQAPELGPVRDEKERLSREIDKLSIVSTPIMRELPAGQRRKSHVLVKGNFLQKAEEVEASVPAKFHRFPADAPPDRLALARWLVRRDNPLTARVTVNRFWAQLFGTGLVETEEDFGSQGTYPSHPELLDHLALDFMDSGFDVKALLKSIVTSATYRQSSSVSKDQLEIDPRNRWLARGPRFRLEAEMVRDQALALSGLLSRQMHGPSVYPPQPEGLWQAAFNGERTWMTSTGEDRYRRALYVFYRRSVPYPSLVTFDAPSRELCTVRRIRTNTPLQGFVTMNDPVYVECAQALARRLLREGGDGVHARARHGFNLCLQREPSLIDVKEIANLHEDLVLHYQQHPEDARILASGPLGTVPEEMDPVDLAAWTVVANVLLNLDGVLMKG